VQLGGVSLLLRLGGFGPQAGLAQRCRSGVCMRALRRVLEDLLQRLREAERGKKDTVSNNAPAQPDLFWRTLAHSSPPPDSPSSFTHQLPQLYPFRTRILRCSDVSDYFRKYHFVAPAHLPLLVPPLCQGFSLRRPRRLRRCRVQPCLFHELAELGRSRSRALRFRGALLEGFELRVGLG
jgi:hypothetical protein